jgi:hypothetical protein
VIHNAVGDGVRDRRNYCIDAQLPLNMIGRLKSWVAEHWPRSLVQPITRLSAFGIQRHSLDKEAHQIFFEHGFHLLRKHYYLPIPDLDELTEEFWQTQSDLVGLDMNEQYGLELLEQVFPRYLPEFRGAFPLQRGGESSSFFLINGTFMAVDAHVYYCLIREFRPRRIVEIGGGNSTLVAAAACAVNSKQDGAAPELVVVEPYPSPALRDGLPGVTRLIEAKIQSVPMDIFTSLESGDILFIDSTHVLRAGGDVQLEYCEILPRLAPGVLVHIHDISLPKPYPRVYFEQDHYYWNEQYLLQAFLTFNSRFEIIWPGNYMLLKYPERVGQVFPEIGDMRAVFPQSEPSSFWIRVKA